VRTRKNLGQRISEELRTDLALILLADVLHAALNQHLLRWIVPAALAIYVSELQALASALTPLGSLQLVPAVPKKRKIPMAICLKLSCVNETLS
jgi:hypothetical protein